MNQIQQFHRDAMTSADQGVQAKRNNDPEAAMRYFQQAMDLEIQAARSAPAGYEPTRSVLYRSAASLALECGKEREAERLAAEGLAGDPPDEIADELREILLNTAAAASVRKRLKSRAKLAGKP